MSQTSVIHTMSSRRSSQPSNEWGGPSSITHMPSSSSETMSSKRHTMASLERGFPAEGAENVTANSESRSTANARHSSPPESAGRARANLRLSAARNLSSIFRSQASNSDNHFRIRPTKLRKDRTSSRSVYGGSSSETSSAANTTTSVDSFTPLIPDIGANNNESISNATAVDINRQECNPIRSFSVPETYQLFGSVAEPATSEHDEQSAGRSKSMVADPASQHRTAMSSFPEVMRPVENRPPGPDRRWTASTYDTSSLSPEKIAKLKKKGINPALYLEMKHARQGTRGERKSRLKLPPLVGNTFV